MCIGDGHAASQGAGRPGPGEAGVPCRSERRIEADLRRRAPGPGGRRSGLLILLGLLLGWDELCALGGLQHGRQVVPLLLLALQVLLDNDGTACLFQLFARLYPLPLLVLSGDACTAAGFRSVDFNTPQLHCLCLPTTSMNFAVLPTVPSVLQSRGFRAWFGGDARFVLG